MFEKLRANCRTHQNQNTGAHQISSCPLFALPQEKDKGNNNIDDPSTEVEQTNRDPVVFTGSSIGYDCQRKYDGNGQIEKANFINKFHMRDVTYYKSKATACRH